MKTKWREMVTEMEETVFWSLPPEIRQETLVETEDGWIRIDHASDDDSDLTVALTRLSTS